VTGRVFIFGDNIDTDIIAPGGFLHLGLDVLKLHSMEAVDANFHAEVGQGDILVAGRNFGGGSSREQAPLVLKELGIEIVLSVSFARIFFRNAINVGLMISTISEEEYRYFQNEKTARYDPVRGLVNLDINHQTVEIEQFGEPLSSIISAGGLVNYVKMRLKMQNDG
jgi:3-isopropylmalate/(R)-2-methylmalate dehydratase small subunit